MAEKDDKEKEKVSRETLGKYFYDLSKTCFASFVVANLIAIFASDNLFVPFGLIALGVVTTAGFARIGFHILNK